ncbi:MAG: hypothetical protein KAV87_27935 [Desulfobacteraceae bacterium]|nr:hypothetical protein [Desulfobacteraceae bacterium]
MELSTIKDVQASAWAELKEKKIYFGHQSVGNNIIDGLKEWGRQKPEVKLRIIRLQDSYKIDSPGLYQASIGKNNYPRSKIDAFVAAMRQGIGNSADVAFFKFCFVDINSGTNVYELFDYYVEKMALLKQEYPKMTFVHFTVPLLKRNKISFKGYIKKLLGKSDGFFDDSNNIRRSEFNRLIREKYHGEERVFDLAGIESTYPDGRRCSFSKNGKIYYSLVPDYTNDGGHLNELGQKRVAEQILVFLAGLRK